MKLLVELPELEEKIQDGTLNMTTVSAVGVFLKAEHKLGNQYDINAKRELLMKIEGKSRRETESLLAEISPEAVRSDRERVIDEDHVELRLTIPKALAEKLQRVREKSSHRNPNPSYAELLEMLADSFLKEPAPPAELPAQKNPAKRRPDPKVERYIRDRDQSRCQYRDPKSGRVCGSTFFTQIDHIEPYAMGGPTVAENLRVLCGAHNRLRP
ncbi:MAG: HNH endonuclease [Bdellovibrionota bacterium]